MADVNTVELSIRMNGLKVDIRSWTAVPGNGVKRTKERVTKSSPHGPMYFDEESCTTLNKADIHPRWDDSSLIIDAYETHHTGNEVVARRYVETGGLVRLGEYWPKAFELNKGDRQIAQMSVNGEVKIPHEMNFFFPVTVTTPDGFTFELLFGQSNVDKGFKATLEDLGQARKDGAKAAAAAETDNDYKFLQQIVRYDRDLVKLFGKGQRWHVTGIGSRKYPSSVFYYGPDYETSTRVLCMGETSKGKVQSVYIHVPPVKERADNKFGLVIHEPTQPR